MLIPALAACAILVGVLYEQYAQRRYTKRCPPVGDMIDVGGRKLHLIRKGTGSPTVVIENGAGATSLLWWALQDKLAEITTVCVYDRAGLGWSDPATLPRTLEERASELHTLLVKAHVPAPYVLVGYSYGGLLVRLFTRDHRSEVAGLVFVDAGHEAVYARPEVWAKNIVKMRTVVGMLGRVAQLGILRLLRFRGMVPPAESLTGAQRAVLSSTFPPPHSYFTMADEFASIKPVAATMAGLNTPAILGDVPVGVVSHGIAFPGPYSVLETHWREGQEQLAALSTNSVLVVAQNSSHGIPIEEPAIVIDAIRRVVTAARDRSPITTAQ